MLLPGLSAASGGLVESVTLSETTGLLSGGGQSTRFSVLVDWVDDPVDTGIATDGLVLRVNEDDLEVFVSGVLVDPVGVQNSQVGATTTDTLLSGGLEGSLVLELVNSLVGWLSVGGTLWNWALAATTTNTDTVDNVSLLGLVTETAGLVWAGWTRSTVNDVQLSELPASDTEKESKHIRLLLLLNFLEIFKSTHLD